MACILIFKACKSSNKIYYNYGYNKFFIIDCFFYRCTLYTKHCKGLWSRLCFNNILRAVFALTNSKNTRRLLTLKYMKTNFTIVIKLHACV